MVTLASTYKAANIVGKMWRLYCFFLLLSMSNTLKAADEVSRSGLCTYGNESVGESLSCASQLWGDDSPNNCTLWLPECQAVQFQEHPELEVDTNLVNVKLRAFQYLDDTVAINVTFSKLLKSKNLRMKFVQNSKIETVNFCRDFTISSNEPVHSESQLFYDCLWSTKSEDQTFSFEYYASDETSNVVGKYFFKIPNHSYIKTSNKNLSQSEIFMYIDLTNVPLLKLKLQMPLERFNFTPDEYNVTLHHKSERDDDKSVRLERVKSLTDKDDELTFEYQTDDTIGSFYFTAQIDHPDCKGSCYVSVTPTYVIKGDPNKRILLIAIVGCGGMLLSVFTFLFFIWRRRKSALQERPPTVLMIYAPTTTKHVTAVVELAKYLNSVCHVEALVDELHIPKSKTKDPFTWCNDAFNRSDFVMVVSSPFHRCNNYEGIYRNVDALGLRLLREKLSDRNSKQLFFNVVLPYCSDKDLPPEAKNLRRFVLTKDINKMLCYLHTNSTSLYSQFCVQPIVYGGYSELATFGTALLKAMKGAGLELGNKDCICNQSQHKVAHLDDEFVTIDLKEECVEVKMLPPREKRQIHTDMYPGPIENLNLLGSEGHESHDEEGSSASLPKSSGGFNLDSLDLG